ncbi:MAG: polysaccharide deacetylase family protein [Paenibacillus sp.]|jgi:peptidoglycan/xylan/chitin deacetylase (PgdA/CDA1 family)|nr:polysaccharide deacetylase family protein [Paenibacillus sp.]
MNGIRIHMMHSRKWFGPLLIAAAAITIGCSTERTEQQEAGTSTASPAARSVPERETDKPTGSGGASAPVAGIPSAGKEADAVQPIKVGGDDGQHHAVAVSAADSGAAGTSGQSAPASAAPVPPASPAPPAKAPVKTKFSIPVLNYHSIAVNPENNAVLDPKKLDEQMAYLVKEGYTTLTIKQFVDIWDGRAEAPAKPILLTFDDGYADNYTAAMPILKKYGLRATMFVSPGMSGHDGYYADWDQIREMINNGWDIQPHGMTHPYLNTLSADKQREQISESIKQVKEQTGVDTLVFCYPYGTFNKNTLALLEEYGVRLAFTIDQGRTEPTQNPLQLKRIFVGGKESMATFINKLK